MRKYSCAIIGLRPAHLVFGNNEADERCIRLKRELRELIQSLIAGGSFTFYSAMNIGVEQWASEIVLAEKLERKILRLIAVLPSEEQANWWNLEQRKRYFNILLPNCDDVKTLNGHHSLSCLYESARYIIDHCEFILAVTNGGKCGCANYAVNYAKKKQRHIITICPDTFAIETTVDLEPLRNRAKIKPISN